MPAARPGRSAGVTSSTPDVPGGADGLLSAAGIRRLAAHYDVRPTKSLGQNFVVDPNTVRRIARVADVGRDDVVLEVGPGLGSLTRALLGVARRVVAVEVDPRLARALAETLAAAGDRLAVVTADALAITDVPGEAPGVLVANLPYNLAVPIVLTLLARFPAITRGVVMVQTEVADRLTAPPGSRVYGAPSAKLAWWADAKRAGAVPRSVFWPVPNVDSALVSFRRHPPPDADRVATFAVIDAAFAQRRKTLRAALAGWAGSAQRAAEIVSAAGVDPGLRGEALTVSDFARIAAARR
ncbi:MAG: 16S rRNA (adenine(1518)-N(6)/adenine(1519)-N(6))-dimethyltransferase RsmA [Mycobacteriales bacterium]|nr:16S rRNA (adenine(1518)-N(6)/adenine(1519)-N(6))-dimethyltransferase RsmA [Frankia sp.]